MTYEQRLKIAKRRNAFALWLTTAMAVVFGWIYAEKAGAIVGFLIWVGAIVMPRTLEIRPFGFIQRHFLMPEQLPWTVVTVIMATLCGYLKWGVDAPFYVALVGVPIVVLSLTLIALDMDPQPDADDDADHR